MERDALDILPKDCWMEALDRVDSKDLKSCRQTCFTFEDILWRKRTAWMFHEILPHVWKYLSHENTGDGRRLFPVSWKPMLNCRLVCGAWREAVDTLETRSKCRGRFSGFISNIHYSFVMPRQGFSRFVEVFEGHPGNPFIGRCIALRPDSRRLHNNNIDGENQSQLQLLERFGKELWTINLRETSDYEGEHLNSCKIIQAFLAHLPNLRTLRIRSSGERGRRDIVVLEELERWEQLEELLPLHMNDNPLPALPHLNCLEVDGLSFMMVKLLLDKYSAQLKTLRLYDPRHFPEQLRQMNCLRELELWNLDTSSSLEVFRQLQSPLEKLSVSIKFDRGNIGLWTVNAFLPHIQHLPVRELSISTGAHFVGETDTICPTARVRNNSIKKVVITLREPQMNVSFNFLLSFPKLEEISVRYTYSARDTMKAEHPNGVEEVTDLKEALMEYYIIYNSDIWEHLPSLNKLSDFYGLMYANSSRRTDHYCRQEYEKLKARKK